MRDGCGSLVVCPGLCLAPSVRVEFPTIELCIYQYRTDAPERRRRLLRFSAYVSWPRAESYGRRAFHEQLFVVVCRRVLGRYVTI